MPFPPARSNDARCIRHQGFSKLLRVMEKNAPLGRTVTIQEVGNTAAFLLSDLASGITGNICYVDAGFHAVAVADVEED